MDEVVITKDMIMKRVAEREKEEADEKEKKFLECMRERERVVECVAKDLRLFVFDCKKLMFDQRVTKVEDVTYHQTEQYVLDRDLLKDAWGKVTKEDDFNFQLLCYGYFIETPHVSGLCIKNTDPDILYSLARTPSQILMNQDPTPQ